MGTGNANCKSLVQQKDGRIVLAGEAVNDSWRSFAVLRLLADGSPDTSFGTGGRVVVHIGDSHNTVNSALVQENGKILVAGSAFSYTSATYGKVLRLKPDGTFDSYSGGVSIGAANECASMCLNKHGQLYVNGRSYTPYGQSGQGWFFSLALLKTNGIMESNSFASGSAYPGAVRTSINNDQDIPSALALDAAGRPVSAGSTRVGGTGGQNDFAVVRYLPDGRHDTSFGTGGIVTTALSAGHDTANGLMIQRNGKIVVAGSTEEAGTGTRVALVRYLADGSPDTAFGSNGRVLTALGGGFDTAEQCMLQADGHLVLAGSSEDAGTRHFLVLRYLGDSAPPRVAEMKEKNHGPGVVTLEAEINPCGEATDVDFEYGMTTAYGTTVRVNAGPFNGSQPLVTQSTLTGLTPGALYHYRVNAANASGVTYSEDRVFAVSMSLTGTFSAPWGPMLTTERFTAEGATLQMSLSAAPPPGKSLEVVRASGMAEITGRFVNLEHGQAVTLDYDGISYDFFANYHGGDGNDLVLQRAGTRVMVWGGTPAALSPAGALAGKTVVSVAMGSQHLLALCADGTLAARGNNDYGQLGDGTLTSRTVPVDIGNSGALAGRRVVQIAAGNTFNLALCSDGSLVFWGRHWTRYAPSVPIVINDDCFSLNGRKIASLATGGDYAVVCTDGTLVQISKGKPDSPTAGIMNGEGDFSGRRVKQVASGGEQRFLALCEDGGLVLWDDDGYYRVPTVVPATGVLAGKTISSISSGDTTNHFICTDGTIISFGYNGLGQFGTPAVVNSSGALATRTPVALMNGHSHTLVLCSDGNLAAWGDNEMGQLGIGPSGVQRSDIPVLVQRPAGVTYLPGLRPSNIAYFSSSIASEQAQTALTLAATDITVSSLRLHGSVNPAGHNVRVWFEYGPTTQYGSRVSASQSMLSGGSDVPLTLDLNSLPQGTLYHYRILTESRAGTVSSADLTATTLSLPTAQTGGMDQININTARVSGTFVSNKLRTQAFFEYGTTLAYGSTLGIATIEGGSTSSTYTGQGTLTSLLPGTLYHYRAKAESAAGVAYGEDRTFTTLPEPLPQATTHTSFDSDRRWARSSRVLGSVQSNNTTTSVSFEYGTTPALGSQTAAEPSSVTGPSSITVNARLTGLQPDTTYYYRVKATNRSGDAFGDILSFTTRTYDFHHWRESWFGTSTDPALIGDLADPNRNGQPNLIEYALGGDPLNSSTPVTLSTSFAPDGRLRLNLKRMTDRADLRINLEAADDLNGFWTTIASSDGDFFSPAENFIINLTDFSFTMVPLSEVQETGGGAERDVTVTLKDTIYFPATSPRRFIRLRVERVDP